MHAYYVDVLFTRLPMPCCS